MPYDYIQQAYGLSFNPRMRVKHTVTKQYGEVRRQGNTSANYVSVRFDGEKHNVPCHPQELKIFETR